MKVLFLVFDGLSPRHVDEEVMPVLASLARDGGWCRPGAVGVLPSSTYPNHATFVTGVAPTVHGLVANEIPGDDGPVPSWKLGPRVPTLFDAMSAAGRSSAAVFGDHHLVGATGADRAAFCWPRGEHTGTVARDILGYAKDRETAPVVVDACRQGAELVFAQFNQPDTAAHLFGPDSMEALAQYGRSDSHLGAVVEPLRDEWGEWVVIIVSDHSQETVTEPEPIDLHGPAHRLGLEGLVLDDGAAAVAGGPLARDTEWMSVIPGVESTQRIDRGHRPRLGRTGALLLLPRGSCPRGPRKPPNHTTGRRGHGRASCRGRRWPTTSAGTDRALCPGPERWPGFSNSPFRPDLGTRWPRGARRRGSGPVSSPESVDAPVGSPSMYRLPPIDEVPRPRRAGHDRWHPVGPVPGPSPDPTVAGDQGPAPSAL